MRRNRHHNRTKRSRQNGGAPARRQRPRFLWTAALIGMGAAIALILSADQSLRDPLGLLTETRASTKSEIEDVQSHSSRSKEASKGAVIPGLIATRRSAAKPVADENPLNPERAFSYLEQLCAIGPRPSGSPGMLAQMRLLRKHFAGLGARVSFQQFLARHPLGGPRLRLTNTIVEWHPERTERILLCAHYDTRPLPDRDPNPVLRREGKFIGANDGASGVALLMELGHLIAQLEDIPFGVDFVFFDGEELVYVDGRDPYFLGSTWFAQQYVKDPPPHTYRWAVLLDMVGDADLQVYQERFSVSWRDTRPLVAQIWGTAQRLSVKEFVAQPKYEVRDDHLPLRNIAKIPACDVIDFDYPAWHTTDDVPLRCSGQSLATVGWVVYEWLKSEAPRVESQESRAR